MGIALDVVAMLRLLGMERDHPLAALRYRNVLVAEHALDAGAELTWSAQSRDGAETAALIVALTPLALHAPTGADGAGDDSGTAVGSGLAVGAVQAAGSGQAAGELAEGELCFLHPHRSARVVVQRSGAVLCVWAPWDALSEIESGVGVPGHRVPDGPLGRGLQAFLLSLITHAAEPTPYSDYFVERLIVEMVFGVLVEAGPRAAVRGRGLSGIDRARSLMLIRRADPDFDVAALAQEMHVSTRQLQRLFAVEGSAPADELRGLRVDLARELISTVDFAPLGIAEIAGHAGFRDAAGLRRAFARAGLPTPRAARLAAVG